MMQISQRVAGAAATAPDIVTVEPAALARAWLLATISAMLRRSESFVSSPSR